MAHSVFQGKRKLLKNLEWKKIYSIQWKISGQTLFSRPRWKNFNTVYSASKQGSHFLGICP